MLRKLIKHDIISTQHEFFGIYLAYILLSIIAPVLLLNTPDWVASLIVLVLLGALVTMTVITTLAIIRLFQRRLFSHEGYLTWTLPVDTKVILSSKIVVAVFWYITTFLVVVVGIVKFAITILLLTGNLNVMLETIDVLLIQTGFLGKLFQGLIIFIPQGIVSSVYAVVIILFVITLVHTAWIKKGRLAIGIVLYFALSLLIGTLNAALLPGLPFSTNLDPQSIMVNPHDPINSLLPLLSNIEFTYNVPIILGQIGLELLYIVLMMIGILWFVEKKLEIE